MRLKEESKLKKEASSSSSISIPNNKKEGPKYNFNFGLKIGNQVFGNGSIPNTDLPTIFFGLKHKNLNLVATCTKNIFFFFQISFL
jgi:hypothetical protein